VFHQLAESELLRFPIDHREFCVHFVTFSVQSKASVEKLQPFLLWRGLTGARAS
jgi:hypothetical protein